MTQRGKKQRGKGRRREREVKLERVQEKSSKSGRLRDVNSAEKIKEKCQIKKIFTQTKGEKHN